MIWKRKRWTLVLVVLLAGPLAAHGQEAADGSRQEGQAAEPGAAAESGAGEAAARPSDAEADRGAASAQADAAREAAGETAAGEGAGTQTKEAGSSPPSPEALRESLRAELRAEMQKALEAERARVRAEVRAAVAASLAAQEWEPDEFEVEEAPKLELFELDGYFRMRGDAFVNFDLNAGEDINGRPLFPRPGWNPDGSDTLASANQRLRLAPTLNVSEDIKIKMTVDVLDNLVWGQTPDAFPLNLATQNTPLLAFTGTSVEPIAGQNAAFDSISVKRIWGEVLTPIGLLRFGRMGSHWGLGVLANDGNCLDCDYGDHVDRLMFVTKIAGHYVVPAIDTPATGYLFQQRDRYQGQAFDLEQRDDVQQYILAVARRDNQEDIEKRLLEGETVLNYGVYNVLRVQNVDVKVPGIYNGTEKSRSDFVERGAVAYIPDLWVRVNAGKLRVEAEAVAILGRIENADLLSDPDPGSDNSISIQQFGAVVQSEYKAVQDKLRVGLELGFASGDAAPGMGIVATPGGASQYPEAGSIDGKQFNIDPAVGQIDRDINNFKFDPDYHVDLILWREIFGQVTDALYLKPTVSYDLTHAFGFDVQAIYSRTIFAESAPGLANDLGVELDGTVRYRSSDGFVAKLQYGILFPLPGLALQNGVSPEIAQTVQGHFAIEF
ncbi:MAG: TIGR04551 family protein [Deltaproteobacteria bacterium]|nr:MAG: TIGR04551 family protein [Deltaproteobacteria bacterium]